MTQGHDLVACRQTGRVLFDDMAEPHPVASLVAEQFDLHLTSLWPNDAQLPSGLTPPCKPNVAVSFVQSHGEHSPFLGRGSEGDKVLWGTSFSVFVCRSVRPSICPPFSRLRHQIGPTRTKLAILRPQVSMASS